MDHPSQKEFEALSARYEKMDIQSTLAMVKLLRTGSDLLADFEKLLGNDHLSQGRFLILVVMNRNPEKPITPSRLAGKIGVTRATMTGLIKGLERDGLVSRAMDDADRRRLQLKLTAKGIRTLESILPDYYGNITSLMAGLTPDEKETLIALLEKVVLRLPFLNKPLDQVKPLIKVIPFEDKYQDQVIDLILNIQQNEFHIPITAKDQPDLNDIPGFYRNGNGNFWIALENNNVTGTISLKDIGENELALRKMFVKKECRGNNPGTAKQLLDAALAWAKKRKVSTIYLGTTEKFLAAHRFYEKNDFIEISKSDLPQRFPVMAVDTKFYAYRIA